MVVLTVKPLVITVVLLPVTPTLAIVMATPIVLLPPMLSTVAARWACSVIGKSNCFYTALFSNDCKSTEVEKYTKGFGSGSHEGFRSIASARQAWSETLATGKWGFPVSPDTRNKVPVADSPGPIVTPL